MKRNIILFCVIIIGFVLQTTLFRALNFGGISPNILIIITASYGFMFGRGYGIMTGFVCGLLMDIFYGDVLGFYALVYLYIGAANGIFNSLFYHEDVRLPLMLIAASDVCYSFVCYVLLYLLRGRFNILFYLRSVALPEIMYTMFVTIFLYPCILLLNWVKPEEGYKMQE